MPIHIIQNMARANMFCQFNECHLSCSQMYVGAISVLVTSTNSNKVILDDTTMSGYLYETPMLWQTQVGHYVCKMAAIFVSGV